MVLQKAPALGIIEEDVHHSAVHVSNLTAICPKFHSAQQRHTSVPRILEGQIKVPATASVVGRWRDEEDTVHPTSIVFHVSEWFAVHNLLPHICPLPWAAAQAICNVSCVFAGSRSIMSP